MDDLPVAYAVVKLVDANYEMIGYFVCKCFLKNMQITYLNKNDVKCENTIFVAHKNLDNLHIDERLSAYLKDYNIYIVKYAYMDKKAAEEKTKELNLNLVWNEIAKYYSNKCVMETNLPEFILKHNLNMQTCENVAKLFNEEKEKSL